MSQREECRPWMTTPGLRPWLVERVLKERGSQRPPSPDACKRLAGRLAELETARVAAMLGEDPDTARAGQIAGALKTLAEVLPKIRPKLAEHDDVAAIDSLSIAVKTAMPKAWASPPPSAVRQIEHWHEIAEDLAEAFRDAMHSTNPDLPLPPSNHGPLTRFLEAIIPWITGETPRQDAIARYLQRHGRACG